MRLSRSPGESALFKQSGAMPVLLGMILGILLAVAGAYTYDTMSGRAVNDCRLRRPAASRRW
jgi:predicted metal-binding membrane protein